MKTSLSSFLYFNYSLQDAIRHTAEAGFDGIDIWGGRPHAYRNDLSPSEISELRALLEELNLEVPSFIPAQFRYPTCLCSNNETIRRDSVSYIQDSINTAAELGAPVLSVCPGHSIHGQGTSDAWGRLSESLTAICEFAEQYDMRIAIEPADRYETDLMNTTTDTMRMIDELGHANLGVLLDNGHGQVVGESMVHAIHALGERLYHIHVDDNDGVRDQHLVPGEGIFNFEEFFAALDDVGYNGFLCAELTWDYTVDPDPMARLSAERLHGWLKQISG